jgi:uncharacterized GH25 family protein/thiol-disulfide isomerase/thioredoxin
MQTLKELSTRSGFETWPMINRRFIDSRLVSCLTLFLFLAFISGLRSTAAQLPETVKVLTVTVLDAASGKPISGAEVTAPALSWGLTPRPTNEWRLHTDERGAVAFRIPTNEYQQFMLSVFHPEYAQRGVNWISRSGKVMGSVPNSYTIRLERGDTVGGMVRDERGQPISGAAIRLSGSRSRSSSDENSHDEYPMIGNFGVGWPEQISITTDQKGFWQVHHVSAELDSIQVDVMRPTGSRTAFTTASANSPSGFIRAEKISLADLRATNLVLTLKDGMTIRGLVVDAAGKPVPNARIKERSGRIAQNSTYTFTNGPDGRFELQHRRAPQLAFTVEAEGFAITSHSLLTAQTNEARIVMDPSNPLRIRVLGQQEEPVSGANFEIVTWRSQNESLDWKGQTDADGRAVWTNAPQQEIALWVRSTNYPVRAVKLRPGAGEQVVKLRKDSDKSITVALKIVDAGTGTAIERFEVWRDLSGYRGFTKESDGTGGAYTNTISSAMVERGNGSAFRFQVRAEGYAIWTSEQLYFDDTDQTLTVKLARGVPPAGVVLQPDGKPAEGANVYLKAGNQGSLFANTQGPEFYAGQGTSKESTDKDGSFKFLAAEDNDSVVITHSTGFASMTVGELKRKPQVRLERYANLSGVVRINGEPKNGERLHLKAPINWSGRHNFLLVFNAASDAEGRFTFTNLPPGDYVLARTPHLIMGISTTESHRWPFDLKPGENKVIEYGFNGRSVIGHVEATSSVNWKNDPHLLVVKVPPGPEPPNYYDFADVKAYEIARDAFGQSAAASESERKQQQFQLLFDTEGNFRADDVPPGTYELRIRATKPPPDRNSPRYGREQEIGSLVREVTIPAGKDEFDLGTFEMEAAGEKVMRIPLEFRAVSAAEDKPFDIASLRGKPVVLTFWGNWAPQSLEFLTALQTVQQEMNNDVKFVTVNLDDDKDIMMAHLKSMPQTWTHTTLRGRDRFEVTEKMGVNTVPFTLLLDSTGRIVTRDVEEKRLRAALKRLTMQASK